MHDYVFAGMSYSWTDKVARLTFRGPTSVDFDVEFTGVEYICIPHVSPWGDSCNINVYSEADCNGGLKEAKIEMQSGDEIVIKFISRSDLISSPYGRKICG